jgi:hypothetical protein
MSASAAVGDAAAARAGADRTDFPSPEEAQEAILAARDQEAAAQAS